MMKTKCLVIGASNSSRPPVKCWPQYVSEHFNIHIRNAALRGTTPEHVYDMYAENIDYNPDLILVDIPPWYRYHIALSTTVQNVSMNKIINVTENYEEVEYKSEPVNYKQGIKNLASNNKYVAGLTISILYKAALTIRISYQAILFNEMGMSFFMIALSNLIMVIPELILMPMFDKKFYHLGFKKQVTLAMLISTFQMFVFIYVEDPITLVLSTSLHGISMAFLLPGYATYLKRNIPENILSSAFLTFSLNSNNSI
jgi:hypothetical protein